MLRRRSAPLILTVLLATTACRPTIIETPATTRPVADDAQAGPTVAPAAEFDAVRAAVRRYSDALASRDAAGAGALVVAETFELYEDLRIAALRSTREQLEAWNLLSVLMILQIRATVGRESLEAIDGRGLFALAVQGGLVGEGLGELSLDEVWIDEAGRAAELRLEGSAIVWLRKTSLADEAPGWRVDIPEMIDLLGPAVEATAQEQVIADGKVRAAYTLLELNSLASVDIGILDGPLELAPEAASQ